MYPLNDINVVLEPIICLVQIGSRKNGKPFDFAALEKIIGNWPLPAMSPIRMISYWLLVIGYWKLGNTPIE